MRKDELFLRCALTIPELLRKIKNEANRLKRELCKDIDAELVETVDDSYATIGEIMENDKQRGEE